MIEVLALFGLVIIWVTIGILIFWSGWIIEMILYIFYASGLRRWLCFVAFLAMIFLFLLAIDASVQLTFKYFQLDTKVSVTLIPPSVEVEKK